MSSRDIKEILTEFYNSYDEDRRLRSRHGMVEFLTTMHYIETYLKPGDRVLEVGAGTGRYSHALARQGYTVDAVELVEHNIKVFRKIRRRMRISESYREMPWICLRLKIIPMI